MTAARLTNNTEVSALLAGREVRCSFCEGVVEEPRGVLSCTLDKETAEVKDVLAACTHCNEVLGRFMNVIGRGIGLALEGGDES